MCLSIYVSIYTYTQIYKMFKVERQRKNRKIQNKLFISSPKCTTHKRWLKPYNASGLNRWVVKTVSSQETPRWPLNGEFAQPRMQIKIIVLFFQLGTLCFCLSSRSGRAGVGQMMIAALTQCWYRRKPTQAFWKVVWQSDSKAFHPGF